jgi:hypothetical protein
MQTEDGRQDSSLEGFSRLHFLRTMNSFIMSMLLKFSYILYVIHESTDCDFEEHAADIGNEINYIIGLYYKKVPEKTQKKGKVRSKRR